MNSNYICEKCGSASYEQVTQTQVRCLQCGHMSIYDGLIKKEFELHADANVLDLVEIQDHESAPLLKRFINYFVDIFVMVALMMLLESFTTLNVESSDIFTTIILIFLPVYYTLMEYKFGKTIGKFITRTRVVSTTGSPLTFAQCVKRALCRFIPFESLSGLLFHGIFWHDSIPKTVVIEDK